MAEQTITKLYNSFVKGLITEATALTYPPNSSVDEDNCDCFFKGNRRRRLGIDLETGFGITDYVTYSTATNSSLPVALQEYVWTAVNQTDLNVLVTQFFSELHFFNLNLGSPISGPTVDGVNGLYSILFTGGDGPPVYDFTAPFSNDNQAASTQVQMASGFGFLFVVSPNIEPFVVRYDPTTSKFLARQIYIQIRDFDGIDDGLSPETEPTTLSTTHEYNLKNQGWNTPNTSVTTYFGVSCPLIPSVSYFDYTGTPNFYDAPGNAPITRFLADTGNYPSNSKQFWYAINSIGDFDYANIQSYSAGNTLAPKGHYILNAFNLDYSGFAFGDGSLTPKVTNIRPNTVAFFSGRVWYGAGTSIYYSQILEEPQDEDYPYNAGKCYQVADPTDQVINAPVASDGGVIHIPEIGTIVRICPVGTGMLVLGQDGVWFIGPGSNGGSFSGTDFSVSKITPIGMNSPNSVIEVDGEIYWWSETGIIGISQQSGIFGPIQGNLNRLNVTDTTIKSFYFTEIDDFSRANVKVAYDPAQSRIQWIYSSLGHGIVPSEYDSILTYNLLTRGFYPWSISPQLGTSYPDFVSPQLIDSEITPYSWDGNSPKICGIFTTPYIFTTNSPDTDREKTFITYRVLIPFYAQGYPEYIYYGTSFANVTNRNFYDWENETIALNDGQTFIMQTNGNMTGIPVYDFGWIYKSYLETSYELTRNWSNFEVSADALRQKNAPWIVTYFGRTEENFWGNDANGYVGDLQTSCLLTTKWDWSSSIVSNKWNGPFELYRLKVPNPDSSMTNGFAPNGDLSIPLDTGYSVVEGRFKVRGRGRALNLRFESNDNYNSASNEVADLDTQYVYSDFNLLGWEIDMGVNQQA